MTTAETDLIIADVKTVRIEPHWDSGWPDYDVWYVKVYDPEYRVCYSQHAGEVAKIPSPLINVRLEELATVEAHEKAFAWIRETYAYVVSLMNESTRYSKGDKVEVVKGRKVPKGTYYVRRFMTTRFGPCVSLSTNRDGTGEFYQFVNVDNIVKSMDDAVATIPYGGFFKRLYDEVKNEVNTLLVLADNMDDNDDGRAEAVRDIANALHSGKYRIGIHYHFERNQ